MKNLKKFPDILDKKSYLISTTKCKSCNKKIIIGGKREMEILKISSQSTPNSVAGAIAGFVKESNKAEMQAIGAGALNQAVKAVAIARGFVAPSGVDLVCIPAFAEVEVEGEDRTGIKLIVESRK